MATSLARLRVAAAFPLHTDRQVRRHGELERDPMPLPRVPRPLNSTIRHPLSSRYLDKVVSQYKNSLLDHFSFFLSVIVRDKGCRIAYVSTISKLPPRVAYATAFHVQCRCLSDCTRHYTTARAAMQRSLPSVPSRRRIFDSTVAEQAQLAAWGGDRHSYSFLLLLA